MSSLEVTSEQEGAAKFEEVSNEELILFMDSDYRSFEEIASRVNGNRIKLRQLILSPSFKEHVLMNDSGTFLGRLKEYLIYDQRVRAMFLLMEMKSLDDNNENMGWVEIKPLYEISKDELEYSTNFDELERLKLELEETIAALESRKSKKIKELEEVNDRSIAIQLAEKMADLSISSLKSKIKSLHKKIYELEDKLFFALTPAGLARKERLLARE